MLIDGEEVIYSMEDKKVVYPEIPTEGLVCYLDTRGKYNTDVYRNTLLDLSGNGNHGTLQNFNFTEESGYVKDISSGYAGLKFDGVDDQLILNLDLSQDFTIFVELDIPATMSGDMRFTITGKEESFYNMTWILIMNNRYAFQLRKKGVEEKYEGHTKYNMRDGLNKIAVRKDGYNITLFLNEEKAESTLANSLIPDKLVWFEKSTAGEGGELTDIKVYNRSLTDEEIQQLMEVE